MSLQLIAPDVITPGKPIPIRFTSDTRVAGRIRLTSGTEALSFRLQPAGGEPGEPSNGPRVRGKKGEYKLLDWGDHPEGTELVLRFEGVKVWMKVGAPQSA